MNYNNKEGRGEAATVQKEMHSTGTSSLSWLGHVNLLLVNPTTSLWAGQTLRGKVDSTSRHQKLLQECNGREPMDLALICVIVAVPQEKWLQRRYKATWVPSSSKTVRKLDVTITANAT